jgi:hypothetical protein
VEGHGLTAPFASALRFHLIVVIEWLCVLGDYRVRYSATRWLKRSLVNGSALEAP